MKTVVLANQKGGVGKSAVATLLAHYLAQRGQRVLAIDLDHQGNFSKPLQRCARPAVADLTASRALTDAAPGLPAAAFVLVPADRGLLDLERQPALHNSFARHLRALLGEADDRFDVCIVDTHPNPDIRVVAALVSADYVLSPIQLNQEALDGVAGLLNHPRAGVRRIQAVLNPRLRLLGLLPALVEPTPFQRANFVQIVQRHLALMIPVGQNPGEFAHVPRRSAIAEAQAKGLVLWEMKKTAARDAWREVEPTFAALAARITAPATADAGP